MKDLNIINFNDLTWQLNIAILGGTFFVFSLIYNDYYIYYGLVTFAFGIIGHVFYKFMEWIFRKDNTQNKYYWITHLINAILSFLWILTLVIIY